MLQLIYWSYLAAAAHPAGARLLNGTGFIVFGTSAAIGDIFYEYDALARLMTRPAISFAYDEMNNFIRN